MSFLFPSGYFSYSGLENIIGFTVGLSTLYQFGSTTKQISPCVSMLDQGLDTFYG